MSTRVTFSSPLWRYTDKKPEIELEAVSIREVLAGLERRFPRLTERILDENGKPRGMVMIFVNDENIKALEGVDTKLGGSDVVSFIPAIAGG